MTTSENSSVVELSLDTSFNEEYSQSALSVLETSKSNSDPSDIKREKSSYSPKFKSYDANRMDLIPQLQFLDSETLEGLRLAARVFPFKVNNYVLDNLIDWNAAPDDPIYRLVFPHQDMLKAEDKERLLTHLKSDEKGENVEKIVRQIRDAMNPHPADQSTNIPVFGDQRVEGVQHKYRETALFFPKAAQTCHSYCSFCFRWPQFVETSAPKFEAKDEKLLFDYLSSNHGITDLLITGGDPMIMNSRRLGKYLELLLRPELSHVQTVRIGTKALTYWPFRFYADKDSADLINLLRKLVDAGKHVAIMAHINHWREMEPEPFKLAVSALQGAGVVIRSQAPILRHVNDNAENWRLMWKKQVKLGIVPYYMFVERDTGAQHYFSVPLVKAHEIYRSAFSQLSGLGRTARGPVMSTSFGKVQVLGTVELDNQKYLSLTFLQARNPDWVQKPFLAKLSETATWLNELEAPDGSSGFHFLASI